MRNICPSPSLARIPGQNSEYNNLGFNRAMPAD